MSDADQMPYAAPKTAVIMLCVLLRVGVSSLLGVESTLAYFGTNGHLEYGFYANQGETNAVNRLPDFSFCGYKGGGIPIPDVPNAATVYPGDGDDTQAIQTAINTVSSRSPDADGFRGAVLLKAGRYQVSSSLRIQTGGVVLRGEGQDILGTVLEAVKPSDYDVIILGSGSGSYDVQSGTSRAITTAYIPSGAITFDVDSAEGYSVGELIIVQRTPNQFWIDDLTMGQWGWTPSGYNVEYERYITAISGNTITVDAPLVDVIQDKYGGGKIYKPTTITRIHQSGVENLRLESCYAADTDEEHPWDAIRVQYAEDSWVHGVSAQYFAYSCVNVGSFARRITVEDCAYLDPKSIITGGRRYSFNLDSTATRILFQRCYAYDGRHDFVLGSKTRGPNVFIDCYAEHSNADSGPHHRWSTGTLFDNIYSSNSISVENRESSGSGHGWSGAQMVFWNSQTPNQKCDAPKGAMNFAIGSVATKREGSWDPEAPFGWWEHHGQVVSPRSLYFQQLADARGQPAVNAVTLPAQRQGRIWDALLAWKGKDRFQPNPLRDAPKDRPLQIGSPVIFEVVPAADSVVVEYQWIEMSGSTYSRIGDNNPLLILPDAQASDFGRTFFCRVITEKGPYWSTTARIVSVSGGTNLAFGKPAVAGSVYSSSYTPDKAVDNAYGTFWNSAADDTYPWWRVDLQTAARISCVTFINRATTTASLLARLSDLQVEILDADQTVVFASPYLNPGNVDNIQNKGSNGVLVYDVPTPVSGRFVRVSKLTGSGQTYSDAQANIAEIQVFNVMNVPDPPLNLTATQGQGTITLDWEDNLEPDFSHYVVYRSETQGTGFVRLAEGITNSNYMDAGGLDLYTRYYYLIRAENTSGCLSGFSNEVSAFPQFSPATPSGLRASGQDGMVHLCWDMNLQPDFAGFTLYRSRSLKGGYVPLASALTGRTYQDHTIENGKTYYYALTAANDEGAESVFCTPVEVIPSVPLNIALNRPAVAGSYYGSALPSYVTDGQVLDYPYIWHSARYDTDLQPWIRIDLEMVAPSDRLVIYNRANPGTYSRNRDFDVDVLDEQGLLVWSVYDETTGQGELLNQGNWMNSPAMIDYVFPVKAAGRYILLTKRSGLIGDAATANISEIEAYRSLRIEPVTGLTVRAQRPDLRLSWNRHAAPSVFYRIYRRDGAEQDFSLVGQTDAATEYLDTAVIVGMPYAYTVTAVDGEGSESGYCGEQTAILSLQADLNGDGKVDYQDVAILSAGWLTENGTDGDDLMMLIEQWMMAQ